MVVQADSTLHTWLKQQFYAETSNWKGGLYFGLIDTLRCVAGKASSLIIEAGRWESDNVGLVSLLPLLVWEQSAGEGILRGNMKSYTPEHCHWFGMSLRHWNKNFLGSYPVLDLLPYLSGSCLIFNFPDKSGEFCTQSGGKGSKGSYCVNWLPLIK